MKNIAILPAYCLFTILVSAASAQTFYANDTAFFNSSVWTSAPSGANFTENFVASGGLYNFTGNESFTSQSYAYGSGSLLNNVTFSRVATAGGIFVDTSNESGAFRSFDAPGSSKYLFLPASTDPNPSGATDVTISFSKGINAFAFRVGDLFDSDGGNKYLSINATGSSGTVSLINLYTSTGSPLTVAGNTITTGNGLWSYFGWTFDAPVTQIKLNSGFMNSTDNIGVDTISFSTVPEPSALSLLGIGLGGLAILFHFNSSEAPVPNQSATHCTEILCLHRECGFQNVAVRSG